MARWVLLANACWWSFNLGLALPWISRWGERLGWWMARYQIDRMHQQARLRELQVHLVLLRAGAGPLMVSAAREQELEYIRPLVPRCEVCGRPRRKCFRTQLLDANRPAPAGACRMMSEGGYSWCIR